MAAEALQILNLSPIPELSEVELSNVLEQFSGLSELTGELTDRNVEDILREAEELLDMSSSVKEISEDISNDDSGQAVEDVKLNEEAETKVKELLYEKEPKELESSVPDSPEQLLSARLKSPSKNHIKSAIDSLKEYSKIIEEQISSKNNSKKEEKNLKNDIPVKLNKVITKSPAAKSLSIPGKSKHIERLSKAANVRKTFNDVKSRPVRKIQSKTRIERKKSSPASSPINVTSPKKDCYDFLGDENEIDFEKCIALLDKEVSQGKNDSKLAEQLLKHSKESVSMLQKEIADLKAQIIKDKVNDRSKWNPELQEKLWAQKDLISSLKEENAKLFQEIKEIKVNLKIRNLK